MYRRFSVPALVAGIAAAAAACASSSRVPRTAGPVTSRSIAFVCDGGEAIRATYLDYDSGRTTFVVLRWRGEDYGLAQALSASGARYAGLYGPTASGSGLQWWEAKGEATLGAFTGKDLVDTRPLLTGCRTQP